MWCEKDKDLSLCCVLWNARNWKNPSPTRIQNQKLFFFFFFFFFDFFRNGIPLLSMTALLLSQPRDP